MSLFLHPMSKGICRYYILCTCCQAIRFAEVFSHAYIMPIQFVTAKIASAKIKIAPAKVCKDVFNCMVHEGLILHGDDAPFCNKLYIDAIIYLGKPSCQDMQTKVFYPANDKIVLLCRKYLQKLSL